MSRQEQQVERVVSRLEDAERLLEEPYSEPVRFALSHFADYVCAGDVEGAWDALADAGDKSRASFKFWEYLADAASMMNLEERRAEALARMRR